MSGEIRARGLGDEDVPRRLPGFDQSIKKRHIEFHFERIFPEVRGIQPIFRILETSPDGEGKIIGADDKVLTQGEFDLFERQPVAHFAGHHAAAAVHGHILVLGRPGYGKGEHNALLAGAGGGIPQGLYLDEAAVPCLAGIGIFGICVWNLVMKVRYAVGNGHRQSSAKKPLSMIFFMFGR